MVSALSTPTRIRAADSAITGMLFTRTFEILRMKTLIASLIAGMLCMKTWHHEIMASVNAPATETESSSIPTIIISSVSNIDLALSAAMEDKTLRPSANASIPAPTAKHAIANVPIAIPSPVMAGIASTRRYPAVPKITNTPAIASRPFAISSKLMLPRVDNAGASARHAADMAKRTNVIAISFLPVPAPISVLFIMFSAPTNAASTKVRDTADASMLSVFIVDNKYKTPPSKPITTTMVIRGLIASLEVLATFKICPTISPNIATAPTPFARSLNSIRPKRTATAANIAIAPAIAVNVAVILGPSFPICCVI